MIFKEAIDEWSGLRFFAEGLELFSGVSRKMLLNRPLLCRAELVELEHAAVAAWVHLLSDASEKKLLSSLVLELCQVVDVYGTVRHVTEGMILDDVELFEIKHFALVSEQIRLLMDGKMDTQLPNVEEVIDVLDPEKNRLSSFYIYDCYDEELALLRQELKHRTEEASADLLERVADRENVVRAELSNRLVPFCFELKQALDAIALIDLRLAIGKQALKYRCIRPRIVEDRIAYKGLFNVQLQELLKQQGKAFQPIDVDLNLQPMLLTGINMGGKTVLLKSLAVAQLLCQFGFYVPAEEAEIALVDGVMSSIADAQNELNGLSSFAAEMKQINAILKGVHSGKRYLILVDELARTTNPTEGGAIVSAFLELLKNAHHFSVVTSHYDSIHAVCRRMRVRGLKSMNIATAADLNALMDYSLVVDDLQHTPHEALKIAELLGVDRALIDKANEIVRKENR